MLSASAFHAYYQPSLCRRRLWLDAHCPQRRAPLTEFEQVLMRQGLEHERRHLATLPEWERPEYDPGDLPAGAEATKRLLAKQVPVIYQGVLISPDSMLMGIPDFLIRQEGGYLVRDVKLSRHTETHPEIAAQLGIYAALLESTGYPCTGRQVVLGDCRLEELPAHDVSPLVAEVRGVLALHEEPEDAVGWSKCSTCGFFGYCWDRSLQAHDPAVVPEICQPMRHALAARGLRRYDDLAGLGADDLAPIPMLVGGKQQRIGYKRAAKALRQVRVLMSGRREIIAPLPPLPQPPVAYFDIESNPWDEGMETRVYLWGLLLDRGNGDCQYWGEVAPAGVEGERLAWHSFAAHAGNLLAEFGDIPFIHYANYERTWVRNYIERFGDEEGTATRLLGLLWDMQQEVVSKCLCLPVHSYGLKHVEQEAGFVRRQQDFGSLWSIGRYHAYLETVEAQAREAIRRELLLYNEEDCLAMRHVLNWAGTLA